MKRSTYPGSIYADRGKLIIKFRGKKYYTGLQDTKLGRRIAEEMRIKIFEDYHKLGDNAERPILIYDAFEDFLEFKINRLPKTIHCYKTAFKKIISDNYYLSESNVETDIRDYLRFTTNSNNTKNIYLRDLQIFLSYCAKKHWLPARDFKTDYKVNPDVIENEIFTDYELQKLFDYFRLTDKEFMLMLMLMNETGARLVDCLTLDWSQVHETFIEWKNKKTKKPEIVPMFPSAITVINELKLIKPQQIGKVFRWLYVSQSSLRRKLNLSLAVLKIPRRNRSFQNIRTTFHMKIAAMNLPLHVELVLMRHRDYKVTLNHYTILTKEEIEKFIK